MHQQLCEDFLRRWPSAVPYKKVNPVYFFSVYNIDEQKITSHTYVSRYGFDHYKIRNNKVVEYYRQYRRRGDISFISYDVATYQPKELYIYNGDCLLKYCYYTHNLLQINFGINDPNHLPDSFRKDIPKELLHSSNRYLYYAQKPYGRIIELSLNDELLQQHVC